MLFVERNSNLLACPARADSDDAAVPVTHVMYLPAFSSSSNRALNIVSCAFVDCKRLAAIVPCHKEDAALYPAQHLDASNKARHWDLSNSAVKARTTEIQNADASGTYNHE